MNENIKQKAGLIYNVVEAVILGMSVLLVTWTANTVITQGKEQATQANELQNHKESISRLEIKGSPQLSAHESQDDQRINGINKELDATNKRIEKLETAVIALQTAPGELKAINVQLGGIIKSVDRIELTLKEHIERKP